jgi:hypothetical protein
VSRKFQILLSTNIIPSRFFWGRLDFSHLQDMGPLRAEDSRQKKAIPLADEGFARWFSKSRPCVKSETEQLKLFKNWKILKLLKE